MDHLWRIEYGFAGSQTMHAHYVLAADEPCPSWLGQVLASVKARHPDTTAAIEIRDVKRLGPITVMRAEVAAPVKPAPTTPEIPPTSPPPQTSRHRR